MKKAILFDRDGTLIIDKHYLHNPDDVEILPFVVSALYLLQQEGWSFFVVTNQSGVGRGYFDEKAVQACNASLILQLQQHGIVITDVFYCPHTPENACTCRKPEIGMWEQLSQRHQIAYSCCIMVGDKKEDMAFAAKAKLHGRILVGTGKGQKTAEQLGIADVSCDEYTSLPLTEQHPHIFINDCSQLVASVTHLAQSMGDLCKE